MEANSTASVEKAVKPKSRGKKSSEKAELKFRMKKNEEFQAELKASLLKRLGVTDPTNVNAINLQSSIVPARIPITFCGIPIYIKELWQRMKAIGTRPFATLATDENYKIFLKVFMYIAEGKLCYAQMKCESVPPFPMTSMTQFSEAKLRVLTSLSSRLPYPLVIYLEAIGNFTADRQPVVPVLARCQPDIASGAVNFAPTRIHELMTSLLSKVNLDNLVYQVAKTLEGLPMINWVQGVGPANEPMIGVDPSSPRFWDFPTPEERLIFQQIIASMESKKGFLLHTDISTGAGSVIQAVRFPEEYDPSEDETLYYMNTIVPDFEEKLAPALMLGHEYRVDQQTRFMSSYQECLKHGSSCSFEARHAVIWADN